MKYIDCKAYAQDILDGVRAVPHKKTLRILTMGNDPASASYVKGKIKDCEYCGIPYQHIIAESEGQLLWYIFEGNSNDDVGGMIVQLPLPKGVDEKRYTEAVRIDKDVDGFKAGSPYKPCTPEGIMYLLRKQIKDLTGLRALVIGRGKLVGEPIAKMLLEADCTVTIAHSKTKNLDELLACNDIIVAAAGKARLVDLMKCKSTAVVIDVGVNRNSEGKLCGDCYNFFESDGGLSVTPVPGGIGLMTRAMLMQHMIR